MAKKTNSKIVPFAITGDYKFRSKNLTIRYGKPITVDNNLEKANKILEDTVRNLLNKK